MLRLYGLCMYTSSTILPDSQAETDRRGGGGGRRRGIGHGRKEGREGREGRKIRGAGRRSEKGEGRMHG